MDLMIQSTVLDTIEGGVVLAIKVEDLSIQAYIVISKIDLSVVEKIIPQGIFESDAQVHVAGLSRGADITEEIVQILENMESGDVVAYLCEDALIYGEALAALGIKH
ncbi:hypothetical protein KZZ10_00110 [Alcaligenaceae bacterium LF4-65]|jgi:hypothetical protein|uniref:Uncharacterized protein n=1 Tax=Zwartia hollandica TaxID=324606 RepID=A0A953N973_9BURK|nr:hypothetical protein [Zwartia hollandica]MBZ1349036.1 hypothetical protein [Zwartia hollandica]